MTERRSVEFPTYHYTSVTDPQTGKQKPYMPTEMLAAPAIPPASGDVEAEHALHFDPTCEECAYLASHSYPPIRAESGGLDVERLARALINGLLPLRHWFIDGETTTENFARWLAAEYARLAEDAHKP